MIYIKQFMGESITLKKIVSFILVLSLIAIVLPIGVFAETAEDVTIVKNNGVTSKSENTFKGNDYSGKIFVATYDENNTMLTFNHCTPENSIRVSGDSNYAYAKFMWWDGLSSLIPKYDAVIVEKYKKQLGLENILQYGDIEEVTKAGITYSIYDGVIKLNGTATGGVTISLGKIEGEGEVVVSTELISGTKSGYITLRLADKGLSLYEISSSRNRKITSNNNPMCIQIPSGATCDNLTFRVWVNKGLSAKPYNRRETVVDVLDIVAQPIGQHDYNTLTYNKLEDDTTYLVYGKQFSICRNGKISIMDNKPDNVAKFAVISDLHYTDSKEFYKRVYSAVNNHNVDFCIMLGDVLDSGYYHKTALYAEQIAQFNESIKLLNCNNYPFCGNHDEDVKEFSRHGVIDFGEMRFIYFWADYSGTSLNAMGSTGVVSEAELEWLEEQLANSPATVNIIGCHYAISRDKGFVGYIVDDKVVAKIQKLAEKYNVKLYFNGHEHDRNITVGTSGVLTDINFPNGHYAYSICELSHENLNVKTYSSKDDSLIKEFDVNIVE